MRLLEMAKLMRVLVSGTLSPPSSWTPPPHSSGERKTPTGDKEISSKPPSKRTKKEEGSREGGASDSDSEFELPPIEDVINMTKEEFERIM